MRGEESDDSIVRITFGLTFNLAGSHYVSATDETVALYWAETGASSGTDTVTKTITHSLTFTGINVAVLTGAATSSPIDATAIGSGSSAIGTVQSGNLVTAQNDELNWNSKEPLGILRSDRL